MDNRNEHKSRTWVSDIEESNRRMLGSSLSLPVTRQKSEKSVRRPRGGRKSIYMDSDEVKACRELGFELEDDYQDHDDDTEPREHQYYRPLERIITNSLSRQYSGNSSSGDNSPIDGWRISSPGDDPRDVKARLKVWAQAVAIESTSQMHH